MPHLHLFRFEVFPSFNTKLHSIIGTWINIPPILITKDYRSIRQNSITWNESAIMAISISFLFSYRFLCWYTTNKNYKKNTIVRQMYVYGNGDRTFVVLAQFSRQIWSTERLPLERVPLSFKDSECINILWNQLRGRVRSPGRISNAMQVSRWRSARVDIHTNKTIVTFLRIKFAVHTIKFLVFAIHQTVVFLSKNKATEIEQVSGYGSLPWWDYKYYLAVKKKIFFIS